MAIKISIPSNKYTSPNKLATMVQTPKAQAPKAPLNSNTSAAYEANLTQAAGVANLPIKSNSSEAYEAKTKAGAKVANLPIKSNSSEAHENNLKNTLNNILNNE